MRVEILADRKQGIHNDIACPAISFHCDSIVAGIVSYTRYKYMVYVLITIAFLIGVLLGRYAHAHHPQDQIPVSPEILYYFALPRMILVRQLLLRDVQMKILLRKSPMVKTTPLERFKILFLVQGFPAWKDHVCIVSATTVRNWMLQFPKGIWSLRTWFGILKSMLLRKLGIKKRRATQKRAEILDAMRVILTTERIRGIDRIHGELKRLGFRVSRPTIARYLRRYFPQYHRPMRNEIVPRQLLTSITNAWAVDFFVLLTFFGKALYIFFMIDQKNRKVVHAAVTFHPAGPWVVNQTKRAFVKHPAPNYLISDNDPVFRYSLACYLKSVGIKHLRITYRSPWQNGIAERWVQTARREVFDRIPIFSSRQAERLLAEYLIVYNGHRTHLALKGDAPAGRPITPKPTPDARLVSRSFADGLAHTFHWADAATGISDPCFTRKMLLFSPFFPYSCFFERFDRRLPANFCAFQCRALQLIWDKPQLPGAGTFTNTGKIS